MKWLPNALTILRCVLAFVVGWAIIADFHHNEMFYDAKCAIQPEAKVCLEFYRYLPILPFVLFVIVAATDFIDGYAARKLNAVSAFGAWLDPIADKLLVAFSLLALSYTSEWWWGLLIPTIAIIGRDVYITWLRSARPVSLPVTRLAKWKTAFEMIGIGGLLFVIGLPSFTAWNVGPPIDEGTANRVSEMMLFPAQGALALLYLAAALSLYTGYQYARAAFSKPAP